jgi:hypothetical protein
LKCLLLPTILLPQLWSDRSAAFLGHSVCGAGA